MSTVRTSLPPFFSLALSPAPIVVQRSDAPKVSISVDMVEGIDESFDTLVLIGYHTRAGTADTFNDRAMSGNVTDFAISGVSLPEAGINALIAGLCGVPVVFVAGDQAICDQVTELFGNVATVAVKKGIGAASDNLLRVIYALNVINR